MARHRPHVPLKRPEWVSLGERLYQERYAHGIGQGKLSDELELPSSRLGAVERDRMAATSPRLIYLTVQAVSKAFGGSLDYLLPWIDEFYQDRRNRYRVIYVRPRGWKAVTPADRSEWHGSA